MIMNAVLPCLLVLTLSFVSVLNAQNLVLNPSFETLSSCPLGPSELDNATNWDNPFINQIGDTCSTSDLYNSCSFLAVGVPGNLLGNEPARTGNGYAGIILSEGFTLFGCASFIGTNWREYVQGRLSAPLVAGQSYCVTFYASLADNVGFTTDDIGVFFSNTQQAVNCAGFGGGPLPVTPQLVWTGGLLNNANGWTQLQWTYTASGGEQFINIGNFRGDGTTTINCLGGFAVNPYAYYFIDDVSVEPGGCGVLAVDVLEFAGEGKAEGNRIWWETGREMEVDHFLVERSIDGEYWEAWEEKTADNLERGSYYELLDEDPLENTWYRLSERSMNGDLLILETLLVRRDAPATIGIGPLHPNPSQGELSFQTRDLEGTIRVEVMNHLGQQVYAKDVEAIPGWQEHRFDLSQLTPGNYLVMIQTEQDRTMRKWAIR